MVDTRFWVSEKAEQEVEEMSYVAMTYTTKNWEKYRNLSEEQQDRLTDILWKNYNLPGIMDMTIEEVLKLPEK